MLTNPGPSRMAALSLGLLFCAAVLSCASCQKEPATSQPTSSPAAPAASSAVAGDGADAQLAAKGSIEVTAQLVEIRYWKDGETDFPPNDLYDYVYIMKYRVLKTHRGKVEGDTIYVGHYNPRKLRNAAADERVKELGGNLKRFRAGDTHRMALEVPIDDYYMGPILNKYNNDYKGPIHFAIWTNRVER
jgi:hypothetical protein